MGSPSLLFFYRRKPDFFYGRGPLFVSWRLLKSCLAWRWWWRWWHEGKHVFRLPAALSPQRRSLQKLPRLFVFLSFGAVCPIYIIRWSRKNDTKSFVPFQGFALCVSVFQSPNSSWAMLSGLIYRLSAVHSLARSFSVVEVLPEPLGPATTQSTGRSSLILVVLWK